MYCCNAMPDLWVRIYSVNLCPQTLMLNKHTTWYTFFCRIIWSFHQNNRHADVQYIALTEAKGSLWIFFYIYLELPLHICKSTLQMYTYEWEHILSGKNYIRTTNLTITKMWICIKYANVEEKTSINVHRWHLNSIVISDKLAWLNQSRYFHCYIIKTKCFYTPMILCSHYFKALPKPVKFPFERLQVD